MKNGFAAGAPQSVRFTLVTCTATRMALTLDRDTPRASAGTAQPSAGCRLGGVSAADAGLLMT